MNDTKNQILIFHFYFTKEFFLKIKGTKNRFNFMEEIPQKLTTQIKNGAARLDPWEIFVYFQKFPFNCT